MKKKSILLFGLALALGLSGCGSADPFITPDSPPGPGTTGSPPPAAETQELDSIHVCYTAITGTQVVTWYAYENHLFEKYGLQVELAYINSGTRAVVALLAGDMDICQLAGSAVVNAVAAGQDAVMLAGLYNVYPASLMVTAEITSPQDLVGRALAITQPGSSTDVATRLALSYLGLEPDTQVALIALGEESTRMAAMQAGQVAGTLLTAPDTLRGRDLGYIELVNLGELGIPYQHTGIGSTRQFVQAHPEQAGNFMKAILEAIARMKTDPQGTLAVMSQYLLLDPVADAASLEDAYQGLVLENLQAIPYPTLPGIQTLIDNLGSTNPEASQITAEQVVDTSVLDSLQESGFFDTLP
jgi:NitT/TauT family transport system substrate-binding protein